MNFGQIKLFLAKFLANFRSKWLFSMRNAQENVFQWCFSVQWGIFFFQNYCFSCKMATIKDIFIVFLLIFIQILRKSSTVFLKKLLFSCKFSWKFNIFGFKCARKRQCQFIFGKVFPEFLSNIVKFNLTFTRKFRYF